MLLTISEIAKRLGTSKTFVRKIVYDKRLIRKKLITGEPYHGFEFDDIVRFIQSQKKT